MEEPVTAAAQQSGRRAMGADGGSSENETGAGTGAATRTARVPKYYRLKRHLLDMTDTMPPGTPVPPERTLAAEFDTSRTTVRQALQELVVGRSWNASRARARSWPSRRSRRPCN